MTQELYALGIDRTAQTVSAFLNHFLPNRESGCENYPVPESSDSPSLILRTEAEILEYLEQHPAEPYGLYWNDAGHSSAQAMAFYARDGKVIFGLAEDSASPAERLRELAEFVGAEYSILGSEQRPPDTAQEFIALCRG